MVFNDFEPLLSAVDAEPYLWLSIYFAVSHVGISFHELGHALAARVIGIGVAELRFGNPVFPFEINAKGVSIRLGLPLGGRCSYKAGMVTHYQYAFVSAGGWLSDCSIFACSYLFLSGSVFSYLVFLVFGCRAVTGLTPLTSDGRKFWVCLYYGTRFRISAWLSRLNEIG